MSIAIQYNLTFTFSPPANNFPRIPIINLINSLNPVNHEIASFLEPNGVRYTQDLINEISHLANSTQPISEFMVSSPCGEDYLEFFSNPGRVVFNTGGQDVIVPANDFIQILNEWKAFVASVPTPHWLENR